ncbi:MAG: hypothetical protein HC837_20760 [Chloroflexaceae bacterium]|nr:hypothetical protein [Chloroflexaceae bacterium]
MSNIMFALQSVAGSAHFFGIRPFTAAFLIALQQFLQAYTQQTEAPFIGQLWVVIPLALIATTEWGLDLHMDTRDIQRQYSRYVAPLLAFGVTMGYIDAESNATLQMLASTVPVLAQSTDADGIGLALQVGASVTAAGVAWFVGGVRNSLLTTIADMDQDDTLGIQSLISWTENIFVVVGLIVFFVLPFVSILLFLLTWLAFFLMQRYVEHREKQSMVPCSNCQTSMFPSATICAACGQPNAAPRQVGMFGQPRKAVATDRETQRFQLIARKRCPVCATRLKEKGIQQRCPTCGTMTFAHGEQLGQYLARLRRRLPKTLLISFGFSCIPLLGLVPGIFYYRISLTSSLSAYMPAECGLPRSLGRAPVEYVVDCVPVGAAYWCGDVAADVLEQLSDLPIADSARGTAFAWYAASDGKSNRCCHTR